VELYLHSPIRLHGVVLRHRNNFTSTSYPNLGLQLASSFTVKVKVKLYLAKHHAMKAYGGMDV
jgi:hypothetical protein